MKELLERLSIIHPRPWSLRVYMHEDGFTIDPYVTIYDHNKCQVDYFIDRDPDDPSLEDEIHFYQFCINIINDYHVLDEQISILKLRCKSYMDELTERFGFPWIYEDNTIITGNGKAFAEFYIDEDININERLVETVNAYFG